jgi:hypothetical protein
MENLPTTPSGRSMLNPTTEKVLAKQSLMEISEEFMVCSGGIGENHVPFLISFSVENLRWIN